MDHLHRFPVGERVLCLDTRHDLVRIANPVAGSMWEMRVRGLGVANIVDAICADYDAPRAAVEADARRFAAELEALEALERSSSRPRRISSRVPKHRMVTVRRTRRPRRCEPSHRGPIPPRPDDRRLRRGRSVPDRA